MPVPVETAPPVSGGRRLILKGALVALWVLGAASAVWQGFDPGGWGDPRSPYPIVQTLLNVLKATGETAVLWLLLRPATYQASWRRLASAFAFFLALTAWSIHDVWTDQPGFVYANK